MRSNNVEFLKMEVHLNEKQMIKISMMSYDICHCEHHYLLGNITSLLYLCQLIAVTKRSH